MNIVCFLVVAQVVGCKDLMQQNAEAPPKKNPPTASIQDKLQLKLESETVVHPSMVALIEAIDTQFNHDIPREAQKSLEPWLCLGDQTHLNQAQTTTLAALQTKIWNHFNTHIHLEDWKQQACENMRNAVEPATKLTYLAQTQEKLFKTLNTKTKEALRQSQASNPLICSSHYATDTATVYAIVTMLPGFPKPASLSMSTGDPNGAALPISLERIHQFDYASIPIDYPWLIQGQLSDQTPVSCQLNLDICERRRLEAEKSHVLTYGEYLELKEINYVPIGYSRDLGYAPQVSCQEYKEIAQSKIQ
jgi:hypothetical protein